MPDLALVAALEGRLVNAWPAFEVELCEGWLLRFAGGYSRRANAATPIVPGARLDDDIIDHIAARYRQAKLRPLFRLTGLESPGADALLAARGLEAIEPSLAMIGDVPDDDAEADPDFLISDAPTPDWVREVAASYGGDKADGTLLGGIVSRIREPAAFATLALDGRPVAWGLGVAERGFVGLYDIVVVPDLRGIGLGRRMVAGLMGWGRWRGATRTYLQVSEGNAVARQLYEGLGFAVAYPYAHRVMP